MPGHTLDVSCIAAEAKLPHSVDLLRKLVGYVGRALCRTRKLFDGFAHAKTSVVPAAQLSLEQSCGRGMTTGNNFGKDEHCDCKIKDNRARILCRKGFLIDEFECRSYDRTALFQATVEREHQRIACTH